MSYQFTIRETIQVDRLAVIEIPDGELQSICESVKNDGGTLEEFKEVVENFIADNKWDFQENSDIQWDTEESLEYNYEDDYNDCIDSIVSDYEDNFNTDIISIGELQ